MKKIWDYFWLKGSKYIFLFLIIGIIRNSNYPNDYYTITLPELTSMTVIITLFVFISWVYEKITKKQML